VSPPSKRRPAAPSCDGLRLARGSWFASAAVGACLRPIYAAVRGTRLSAANLRSERCYDVPEDGTAIGTTAWWLRVQARPATPGAGWFRVDLARNVTRRHAVTYRSIDAAAIEAGRARTPQLVHSTDVWEKLSVFVRSSCIKSSCPPGAETVLHDHLEDGTEDAYAFIRDRPWPARSPPRQPPARTARRPHRGGGRSTDGSPTRPTREVLARSNAAAHRRDVRGGTVSVTPCVYLRRPRVGTPQGARGDAYLWGAALAYGQSFRTETFSDD